jgi:alanyl-tRNA synthetase
MTSVEIRQSFLDFFKSKGHTIVPSSSLMPDSPNLLFTNAGMNQFVPIFLGQTKCPYTPARVADTQKCIRAGGKHNDLEDVGLDTYHHTFFEMLGNWSFGDYFKKEAIEWAWELLTEVWKFPRHRLYATVYGPDKASGDPSDFDQEAYDFWAAKFSAAGLDPKVHILHGNKKDNFWMMGETGPCGPCSEIHVDLTPAGDTQGALVNKGDARCIEIWNLVFIQFNAKPDGTFSPLPARHVDTGMGFERVTGIMQNTNGFKDFSKTISNYETDIFRPLFDKIEKLSGKQYKSTLPKSGTAGETDQEKIDIAFRVIADHIRTLSFAIADGILPGNNDRNYVLRRILRRAVRYGRTLGFHEPFFYKLVEVLAEKMGDVFPEVRKKQSHIQEVIKAEEEAFNKTLDDGIAVFEESIRYEEYFKSYARKLGERLGRLNLEPTSANFKSVEVESIMNQVPIDFASESWHYKHLQSLLFPVVRLTAILSELTHGITTFSQAREQMGEISSKPALVSSEIAFALYDTYGFPLDLTELMARERGLPVDVEGFNKLMDEQRARGRAAQKKEIISASNIDTNNPTVFIGFNSLEDEAKVLDLIDLKGKPAVILDETVFYAEMGGQVGDTGKIIIGDQSVDVIATQKVGNTFVHFLIEAKTLAPGAEVKLIVDRDRREAIQRHHSVTHLLHWALHEVVSPDATQKGSYVGPDKLTFDFSSAALDPAQVADVERLVNERILENAGVTWTEVPYAEVKARKDIMQFFGEKYGDMVRVVQIGGKSGGLDGYSMELCGGTHTRATGEVGLFRILSESAIAAGIRRIEAVAGLRAYAKTREDAALISSVAGKVNSPVGELEKRVESLLAQQKDLEKQLKSVQQKQAAELARGLAAKAQTLGSTPAIIENLGAVDGDFLQSVADALKGQFKGVVVLGGTANNAVALVACVSSDFTKKLQAGKIMQAIAPLVGGRGGGKPDNARGGGKDVSKLDAALKKATEMLKSV